MNIIINLLNVSFFISSFRIKVAICKQTVFQNKSPESDFISIL